MYYILIIIGAILILNIGIVIGIKIGGRYSKKNGYVGIMNVKKGPDGEGILYSLELHEDPEELQHMKQVVFRVEPLE